MPATLDQTRVTHNLAPLISNSSHCQRVAILSSEIGRRFGLDPNKVGILSEAAIHHHSMILQWDQKGLPSFGPMPKKLNPRANGKDQPIMALEIIEALRVFNGIHRAKPGSAAAITSEILHLANAFDEIYEWRFFESYPASESIKELDSSMHSGLWSQPVLQAFHAIFSGSRDRALAKAKTLSLSTVSRIKHLAFANADHLTINGLEQMALADPVISADLLRSVNSAKYAVTARGIFASSSLHRLWKHSVQCASTMKALACYAGLDPNRAFLLGLLHDIGRMTLVECLDTVTRSNHTQICETEAPAIWLEMAIAGCDHAELGADILAGWKFPECIVESIRNHHSPQVSTEKLTALLYLVESVEGPEEDLSSPSRVADALSRIGMSRGQFERALTGTALFGKAVAFGC